MPELVEHVAYLSQEIGPRPAGTEEEQQAALYITEQLQKDAGLSAVIEDFSSASSGDLPRVLCCGITLVVTVLSMFVSVLAIPAVILTLITAVLFAAEAFDKPVLSKLFARGVSQNVVAKYEPGYTAETGGTRRRKIVLVARYDSGKVRPELNGPVLPLLPALQWANLGAMVFIPLLLLVRSTLFLHATGAAEIVFNVLTVIALVLVALPLVGALAHKLSAYNEGANCNASGTAVLLEVARRVGCGRVSEAELAARDEAVIHGEDAARAAGLVPEGAQLVYEAAQVKPPEIAPQSAESRLAAAKAAVAALSGKPVSSGIYASDIAQNLVQVKEPPLPSPTGDDFQAQRGETREALTTIPPETVQAALAHAESAAQDAATVAEAAGLAAAGAVAAPVSAPSFSSVSESQRSGAGVPDWFKKAQEKAKKPAQEKKPVQRSRYASALDAAVSESAGHFAEANNAVSQEEQRLEAYRDEIREVKAPQWAMASEPQTIAPTQPAASAGGDDSASMSEASPVVAVPTSSAAPAFAAAPMPPEDAAADPFSTTAMPPIDVSDLHLGDVPPVSDVPMPAFLDPRNAQREAQEALREELPRTGNRVDVTASEIGSSGRIEQLPSEEAIPAASAVPGTSVPASAPATAHRPIVLPDIGVAPAGRTSVAELSKQRAPLAEAEEAGGKSAAKSLLNMLPAIDLSAPEDGDATGAASSGEPASAQAALRTSLPSLSGAISSKDVAQGASSVSLTGAFVPAGATGTFAPVGDELIENIDPNDIYVDDADDSAYEDNFTETGAFAGPGYVEMPKSRVHRLFDRFRRKGKDEEATPQEWLDVDDSFDARTVGAERGGWESFRQEDGSPTVGMQSAPQMDYAEGAGYSSYDEFEEEAYEAPAEQPSYFDDEFDDFNLNDISEDDDFPPNTRGRWQGGAFSRMRIGRVDTKSGPEEDVVEPDQIMPSEPETPPELKQIYQFRNPDINTEVWFVALGSELSAQSGIRAFLAEHQQDLRGSIIVDLDALGAGSLSMIEREGKYRKAKTSSRMKRYIKKASQATGISVGTAEIGWKESAASYAIKHGFQAMHLVGMDGAKPALLAQGDDVLENIDEDTLKGNADFVMELLKNI